jgi:hypothetical protein
MLLQIIKAVQSVYLHEEGKIQRSVDPIDLLLLYRKLSPDMLQQSLIDVLIRFQPDRLSPLALL